MIILGDKLIPYDSFFKISKKEDIFLSKANSCLLTNYDKTICSYLSLNSLKYAVHVYSIKEAIYANALDAKYLIVEQNLAKQIQDCAESYMFDSKVIATIENEDEIERFAVLGIDGVIFNNILD